MTDAQIALYASLRVAVPGEWRISFDTRTTVDAGPDRATLIVFLTRPVFAEPGPLAPGFARFFRLPNRAVVGTEKLALATPLDVIEDRPESHRYLVYEALDKIGEVDQP